MKLGDRITNPVRKFWQQHPRHRWILSILWVLLIGFLAFFWNLGNIGLIDETEPLFAEAARQMTVTDDWIVPFFNGKTRFDKPPLVYWLMAIAYKIIGVNEWGARLPSAIAALSLTALGFYTLRRFGFPSIKIQKDALPNSLWLSAWIGAPIIALNPITIVWARTGVSDMLLVGCMGSALLCFFIGYAEMGLLSRGDKKEVSHGFCPWYLAFYILSALAVLAKGPVGIALPGLIIGTFLIYVGKFRVVVLQMRPLLGGLIFAAITIPWYVLVIWKNGEAYINSFFGYHNLQRFTSVVNGHVAPWYFYFLVVLVGFAPWSSYLPLAIARIRVWDRKYWQAAPASTQLGLFALFWFAGVFGFFTIAVTKLPSYVLPLMPAAAIMVTLLWSEQMTPIVGAGFTNNLTTKTDNLTLPAPPRWLWWSGLFNLLLVLAIASVIFFCPYLLGYDPAVPNLKQVMQQSGIPLRGGIIWGITAAGLAFLLRKKQLRPWLWSANLLGFIAFLIFVLTPGYFLVDKVRQMPLRELAAIAVQQQKPGEELIMVGFEKPSLVFYTERAVTFFPSFEFTLFHIQQTAAKNPVPPTVLILTQYNKNGEEFLQPGQYKIIGQAGSYRLIRVFKKQLF